MDCDMNSPTVDTPQPNSVARLQSLPPLRSAWTHPNRSVIAPPTASSISSSSLESTKTHIMSSRARGKHSNKVWPGTPEETAAKREVRKKPEEEEEEAEEANMDIHDEGAVVEMSPEEEGEDGETSAQLTAHDESGALVSSNGNGSSNAVAQQQAGAVEAYGTHQPVMPEYRDITTLLNLPQVQAARQLKMPMSTLSKRWKEAVRVRKWPYRQVAKLDKEIMTLLHNIPPRGEGDAAPTPPEIEQALGVLLRRRQEELRPVRIRM